MDIGELTPATAAHVRRHLESMGRSVDELQPDDLGLMTEVIASFFRPDTRRLTLREAADEAGLSYEDVRRLWCALGFPEPPDEARRCSEADVELLGVFGEASEFLGDDAATQLARVIGSALARVAEAGASAFRVNVAAPAWEGDASGAALLEVNARIAELVTSLAPTLETVLRHHIEAAVRPSALTGRAHGEETIDLTVAFVDLVDSARWGTTLDVDELGAALRRFETLTSDVAARCGARIIKFMGDGVMFVADSSHAACTAALEMTAACAREPGLPGARGGVAAGEVVTWEGDYFGPVVNLAARLVNVAAPGQVAVHSDSVDVDGFSTTERRAVELKGFDRPVAVSELMPNAE